MSQQNLELIRRLFDEAPSDPEVFFAALDDEVEWDAGNVDIPDAGASRWRGPAGVREFFRHWVGPFDEWGFELVDTMDVGDSIVAHVHQWGRGKGSGATVETRHWHVWTVHHGKVVRVTLHVDREAALAAAGAAEADRG